MLFYIRTESAYSNTFINKAFVSLFSVLMLDKYLCKNSQQQIIDNGIQKKFKFSSFDVDLALITTPETDFD